MSFIQHSYISLIQNAGIVLALCVVEYAAITEGEEVKRENLKVLVS
jgi:hypothetical protein